MKPDAKELERLIVQHLELGNEKEALQLAKLWAITEKPLTQEATSGTMRQ